MEKDHVEEVVDLIEIYDEASTKVDALLKEVSDMKGRLSRLRWKTKDINGTINNNPKKGVAT